MKLDYYPETDSLYIDLLDRESSESRVISEGVVLDYDADGNLVGTIQEFRWKESKTTLPAT